MASMPEAGSGWGFEASGWDVASFDYPKLPRAFQNKTAAKRKRHKELYVTEEQLLRPVKLGKTTGGAKAGKQHQGAAAAAAAASKAASPGSGKQKSRGKEPGGGAQGAAASRQQQPAGGEEAAAAASGSKKRKQEKHKKPRTDSSPAHEQQQDQQQGHTGLDDAAPGSMAAGTKEGHQGKEVPPQPQQNGVAERQQPAVQQDKGKKEKKKRKQKRDRDADGQQQQQQPGDGLQPQQSKQRQQEQEQREQQQQQQQPKKKRKLKGDNQPRAAAAPAASPSPPSPQAAAAGPPAGASGSKLLDKMRARLQGGRFRQLNEALYTQPGQQAFRMMQQEPELFEQYHQGFKAQVASWPLQPQDAAIAWVKGLPQEAVVADFGCGDARLAASVPQEVHSLDLVASAPGVIACNMARTPLESGSCDAAVFSLALMGIDYGQFLQEAQRVLKANGWLWLAEVRSRFAAGGGKEDFGPFLSCLRRLGFKLKKQDSSNTMFVIMLLKKVKEPAGDARSIAWPPLGACLYKRR